MIFCNFKFRCSFYPILIDKFKPKFIKFISMRGPREVIHDHKKTMFYIVLGENNKHAVLLYKLNGNIMDLYSINVPKRFGGQGLARLLTDNAFTYAIVNDYFLYLTCSYTQSYYLANKNSELQKRIVGPKQILNLPVSLDPENFESMDDPQDFSKKNN